MNTLFLCIVIFLIILAVFDLVVGVSNAAVNFLNSAIGAKVARFRTIVIIASIGVFAGASLSNGMLDVARHGIMTPEFFSFYDVMCIFMAVMLTDVLLLDEPTSGLDDGNTEIIKNLIREYPADKICILSTHDSRLFDLTHEIIDFNLSVSL